MRKLYKTLLVPLLFVSLMISGCGDDGNSNQAPQPPKIVKTMTVGDKEAQKPRQYPGTVKANETVDLAFQVSGQVIEFPLNEGQEIDKNGLVAQLDKRDYENALNVAKAELDRTLAQYNRAKELVESGTIAQAKYEEAKAAYEVAQGQYQIALKALEDTRLVAPFDGRIAKKYVNNFQNVVAKEPIISLQAVDYIDIVLNIPEEDMMFADKSKKQLGKDVVVFAALPDREFPVELKEYSTQADPDTQTFRVVLTMQAPTDVNILPGMTATFILRSRLRGESETFTIPSQSVLTDADGENYVWLVTQEMTVAKQVVSIGELTGGNVQVLKGLSSGDQIVIAGASLLSEGMRVKLYKS